MLAMALAFGMAAAGCDDGSKDSGDGGGGNVLPAPVGANALSGKTYIEWNEKIEFNTTAEGAKNGAYTKKRTYYDEEWLPVLDEEGKYIYTDIETGYYSWNATAETITMSPEKVALYDEDEDDEYGPLLTKQEYRTAAQNQLNTMKSSMGEEAFNAELQSEGYSSIAALLDYIVDDTFKNITNNYVFSADAKALFLDEVLPANKGTNELSGQTYHGTMWNNDDEQIRDESRTYAFTASNCTYTQYDTPQIYTYGYDSTAKIVYLKTSTDTRESTYTQLSDNTNSGHFTDVDEYNAAEVNSQYNRSIKKYKYITTTKVIQDAH